LFLFFFLIKKKNKTLRNPKTKKIKANRLSSTPRQEARAKKKERGL